MADEKRVIFAGYVCEVVDRCTCAGGGEWPHEPHCGLEPLHLVTDLPRLVPSWRFVVPKTSEGVAADNLQQELDRLEGEDPAVAAASAGLDEVYEHLKGRLPSPLVAEIYDLERPYERVLGEDELHD